LLTNKRLSSGGGLKPNKYVAIKIRTSNTAGEEDIRHELDMTIHISSVSPEHRGRAVIATAIEGFSLDSPTGSTHLSLVFEPMREPLWLFRRRVAGEDGDIRLGVPLIKAYLQILLEGLDYLHSECHVIHTGISLSVSSAAFSRSRAKLHPLDLKLDNILVTFEDQSVIEAFVQGQDMQPMARKRVGDRILYRCHNDFGPFDGLDALKKIYPKITDFGLAQQGDQPGPLIFPIQPNEYHAPEVLLGTG